MSFVLFFYVFHSLMSERCPIQRAFVAQLAQKTIRDGHGLSRCPRRMTHSALWTATTASKQPAQYEETSHTWKSDALTARWPWNPGVSITLALSSCNGEEGAACYQNKSASTDSGDRAEIRVYFFNPHLFLNFLFLFKEEGRFVCCFCLIHF